jgi:hypothetical protein
MVYKAGTKLRSAVCDAQVIVVRAPATDVELACGGSPLIAADETPAEGLTLDAALSDGVLIGKRYAHEDLGLELLCTRAGSGTLTVDGTVLALKGAKPLPASD